MNIFVNYTAVNNIVKSSYITPFSGSVQLVISNKKTKLKFVVCKEWNVSRGYLPNSKGLPSKFILLLLHMQLPSKFRHGEQFV